MGPCMCELKEQIENRKILAQRVPGGVPKQSAPTVRHCPACSQNDSVVFLQAPDRFHGRQKLYQLLRCPSCSLVWLKNPPPPGEIDGHYGIDYDRAVTAAGKDPQRWLLKRKVLLEHKSGGAILDLGCSSGAFLASLKSPSWTLFGIEKSAGAAEEAGKTGARIFIGDILDAPFPSRSFDAITCFHVFEHLYKPREVLARVSEWLKPGGIFYTMMPNIDSAGARIFRSYWYALELPRHLYHFSPVSLTKLAESVGLRDGSITTYRELFIESSVRYICDDFLQRLGISRAALAKASEPSFPFKVARKMFRLTALPVLNCLAMMAGDGESIHAVFRSPNACADVAFAQMGVAAFQSENQLSDLKPRDSSA